MVKTLNLTYLPPAGPQPRLNMGEVTWKILT